MKLNEIATGQVAAAYEQARRAKTKELDSKKPSRLMKYLKDPSKLFAAADRVANIAAIRQARTEGVMTATEANECITLIEDVIGGVITESRGHKIIAAKLKSIESRNKLKIPTPQERKEEESPFVGGDTPHKDDVVVGKKGLGHAKASSLAHKGLKQSTESK